MNDFVEKRQQLKLAYTAKMPSKKTNLQQQYEQLQQGIGDVESFYADLHKLSGSAGMYGFEEISQSATKMMKAMQGVDHHDMSSNVEISEIFADLLAMMKNIE